MTPSEEAKKLADKIEQSGCVVLLDLAADKAVETPLNEFERNTIISALRTAVPDWMGVESAPLETALLVCNPERGSVPVVAWRYAEGWKHGVPFSDLIPAPTYYMPLPAPPSSDKGNCKPQNPASDLVRATSDVGGKLKEPIRTEMERIRGLFEPSEGDKEDLISYAKEVVILRGHPTRTRKSKPVISRSDRASV